MNKPRKLALAVLASITIAGIAGASASSLGNLNNTGIGSDDEITAACDTDGIDVSYVTNFVPASTTAGTGANVVTRVNFASVNQNCDLGIASLTLVDASNTPIASESGSVAWSAANGGSFGITLTTAVPVLAVEGISLVIQG